MISKSIFFVVTYWISCVQCFSNVSLLHPDIPQIREGEPCIKGKMYKMSCNTCHCADNNALYCTKMACLDDENIERLRNFKNRPLKALRRGSEDNGPYLPNLPKGVCVPGKIYRKGCRKCYCDDKRKPVCSLSTTKCKKIPKLTDVLTPNDVSPPMSDEDSFRLPILPHSAAKCEPGRTYMVDCNSCLCLNNGNLLCEKMLCLNEDDANAAKAKMWSGSPCKKKDRIEDTLSTRCIRCSCIKNKTQCRHMRGCVMPKLQKVHGSSKIRLSLVNKEKCEPNAMYNLDCNYCYCQSDRSLLCTQKTCLNYQQALNLKKLSLYLEEHGL